MTSPPSPLRYAERKNKDAPRMTFSRNSWVWAIVLSLGLLGGTHAFAQAAHDTSLLTEAERTHYRALLAKSTDSAERAKVKSEMNRLIQTRRLDRRKAQSQLSTVPLSTPQK